MAVSAQRLVKHVPATTDMQATIELLLETGCFLRGPYRDVISKGQSQLWGCTGSGLTEAVYILYYILYFVI
jgi:hypothetical protein